MPSPEIKDFVVPCGLFGLGLLGIALMGYFYVNNKINKVSKEISHSIFRSFLSIFDDGRGIYSDKRNKKN